MTEGQHLALRAHRMLHSAWRGGRGRPTSLMALAAFLDAPLEPVRAAVEALRQRGLVQGHNDALRPFGTLRVEPRRAQLGGG